MAASPTKLRFTVVRRDALLIAVLASIVAVVSGCDSGPAMHQVRGTVHYKDGSVPRGGVCAVQFVPTSDSTTELRKGAGGRIAADGSFELYTRVPGDGVVEGEYDVTFAVWKGVMDPTSLIDEKYTNPLTTPYQKIKVDGDIDDLKFEIEPLPGAPRAATAGGAGGGASS
jgi:hypothetical protein